VISGHAADSGPIRERAGPPGDFKSVFIDLSVARSRRAARHSSHARDSMAGVGVLHHFNDPVTDARLLQGDDRVGSRVKPPAASPDFVADDVITEPALGHFYDIAGCHGPVFADSLAALIRRSAHRVIALFRFILGVADQTAGKGTAPGSDQGPGASVSKLLADNGPDTGTGQAAKCCTALCIVLASHARPGTEQSEDEASDEIS